MRLAKQLQKLFYTLLLSTLWLIPLGNLLRYTLPSGVAIVGLDFAVGITALCGYFALFLDPTKKAFSDVFALDGLKKKNTTVLLIYAFFGIMLIGLLLASTRLSFSYVLISSLYFVRLTTYVFLARTVTILTESQHQKVFETFKRVLLVTILFGFIQYFFYPDLRNLTYFGWDRHYYRMFGTFFDPNFFGAMAGLTCIVVLHFYRQNLKASIRNHMSSRHFVMKVAVSLSVTLIALFLTYSRTTYLMFFLALFTIAFFEKAQKYSMLIILASVIILYSLPTSAGGEGVDLLRSASIQSRLTEYSQAFSVIKEHPILGVGFNTYRYSQIENDYVDFDKWGHNNAASGVPNSYIFVLVTTGIVGLFLFLGIMIRLLMYFIHRHITLGIYVLIIVLAHSLTENSFFYPFVLLTSTILLQLAADARYDR